MLVDLSYFRGNLLISNLTGVGLHVQANSYELVAFIEKYEPEFLNRLLTEPLYAAFKTGLEQSPVEDRWSNLRAQLIDEFSKKSPIAGYIYYKFMSNRVTVTSAVGEVKPVSENALPASSVDKLVRAWNNMVKDSMKVNTWLLANLGSYPEFDLDTSFPFGRINSFGI